MAAKKSTKKALKSAKKAPKKVVAKKAAAGKKPSLTGGRHYEGPEEWLLPQMEEAYSRIRTKDEAEAEAAKPAKAPKKGKGAKGPAKPFISSIHEGKGESEFALLPRTFWQDQFAEFHKRRVETSKKKPGRPRPGGPDRARDAGDPGAEQLDAARPLDRGARPDRQSRARYGTHLRHRDRSRRNADVCRHRQRRRLALRRCRRDLAVHDGQLRSESDQLRQHESRVRRDRDQPSEPRPHLRRHGRRRHRRHLRRRNRQRTAGLPRHRSDSQRRRRHDMGDWKRALPSLAGFAFFQIAVDPADPDHCVAATTNGLYERVPAGGGGFEWIRRRTGNHSSVVVSRAAGVTNWFAAASAVPWCHFHQRQHLVALGTGFPTGVGRIALGRAARQSQRPLRRRRGRVRLAAQRASPGRRCRRVGERRPACPAYCRAGRATTTSASAVDPNNANRIYLGGDYFNASPFPGSIWRCAVSPSGAAYSMTGTSIGRQRARRRPLPGSHARAIRTPLDGHRRRPVREPEPDRRRPVRASQHRARHALHELSRAESGRAGSPVRRACRTTEPPSTPAKRSGATFCSPTAATASSTGTTRSVSCSSPTATSTVPPTAASTRLVDRL